MSHEASSKGLGEGEFFVPSKAILSPEDLETWKQSPTHQAIVDYIAQLNSSIINKKLTDDVYESENIRSILKLLERVEAIAQETPPVSNDASRFGNPAFKTFYDKVQEVAVYPTFLSQLFLKYHFTCKNAGGIARALTMEVEWNLISFVGCSAWKK
ncbi:peptidylprolyl isomerase [Rhizoctonia solani AG-1 IB]|uniref:Serine/threonine-protein phosphatase 2A activator n=1 Tax=Thanatephorus cucumeris (strain AG1-IB / isolate 7/3/14) TaxID=1108050 RepID=M5C7W3_THACB|nr:peptidylprolyl isomerase [Rhizoctonia solani AG-1 IB]